MVFLLKAGNGCPRPVQKVARTLQDLLTVSTPQIVVAQHHNGRARQIRPEHPLAAGVEAVAVDQGNGRLMHGSDANEDWLSPPPRSSAHHPP